MKAKPSVKLTATPAAWLGRLLRTVCRCAAGDLKRMPVTPEQSIHALRVRMKKLRALLRLMDPILTEPAGDRLRRRVRDIKNAFTGSRETEVLQKLARQMRHRYRLPALPLRDLAVPDAVPLPQVKRMLTALRRELVALPLECLTPADFIRAYAARCRACRRGLKRCAKSGEEQAFHRWRKRVKEWYFLSLTLHSLPSARACIRPAERLGHWLGEEHDLALLADRVEGKGAKAWRQALSQTSSRMRRRILAKAAKMPAMRPRRLLRRLTAETALRGRSSLSV